MTDLTSALQSTVSITLFNRGMAGKIFSQVKQNGPKVVMKNNKPECVLVSPEQYMEMMDEVFDARIEALAWARLQNPSPGEPIPAEELYAECGLTEEDLEGWEDIEFE